ncbi:MAG: thioredoxin-dependent thiol peroxidase [Bacilli bacterium]|nr:thioredoxin-dependent thiol peroxidase [Bacilli bacterium]
MINVGMKAPNFTLLDQNNKKVSLSDFLGKKVVVYFYPKDHTPGCTTQACAFRDAYDGFKEKDIVVIGISKDSVDSHQKFIEDYNLPFMLLSDPELEAIQAYDVWKEKNMYGKITMGVARSTYIIDEEGNIAKIFLRANPDTNAKEILDFLG